MHHDVIDVCMHLSDLAMGVTLRIDLERLN